MIFRRSDSFESSSMGDLFRLPFRFIGSLFQFAIDEWSTSRNGLAFLRSSPAILGILAFAVPLIVANYVLPSRVPGFYRSRTNYFLNDVKDNVTAENLARKLVSINPDNRNSFWLLGETLHAQAIEFQNENQPALAEVRNIEANAVMNFAADFTEDSSFRAHIWLANQVFEKILMGQDSPEIREVARTHLKFVSENADSRTRSESIRANLSLVRLYMNEADFENAEKILDSILKDDFETVGHVEAALLYAQLLKNTRSPEEVDRYCRTTVERLLNLAIKYPDIFDIWRAAVELTLFRDQGMEIREFERARGVIRTGIELATDPQNRRRIAALGSLVLLRQARMMEDLKSPPEPQSRYLLRLGLLALAIKDNPMEPASYHEIIDIVRNTEDYPEGNQWRARAAARVPVLFRERNFNVPADFLFIFNILDGVVNGLDGKTELMKNDWLQAKVQSQITPVVINNFMMILMAKSKDNAESALQMIKIAEELFSASSEILFIRSKAEVYFVSEDWGRARDELEKFISKEPKQVEAHKKLIEVYSKLNDTVRLNQAQQRLNRLEVELLQTDSGRLKR